MCECISAISAIVSVIHGCNTSKESLLGERDEFPVSKHILNNQRYNSIRDLKRI